MTWLTTNGNIDEINRWLSSAHRDLEKFGGNYSGYPRVDVIEYSDKITLEAELHGLERGDVSVEVNNNILSVRGGRKTKELPKDGKYLYKEIKRSSFERTWDLDNTIDQLKITATFENGKLLVVLPKATEKKPTKIKVL